MKGNLGVALGMFLLVPHLALAQESRSLESALARVPTWTELSVLTTDGQRVKARLDRVTASGLTLVSGGDKTLLPAATVGRVTIQDSNSNGAKIGGTIGGAIGVLGSLALGALCANEGASCAGGVLGIMAAGIGGGVGIGVLADSLHKRVVYDNAPTMPRNVRSEIAVRMSSDSGHMKAVPALTGSWALHGESGAGVEANLTQTYAGGGTGAGDGRGMSVDGRVLYQFGRGRVRPYATGGLGYFERQEQRSFTLPLFVGGPNTVYEASYKTQGLAPIAGGGARIRLSEKLSLRPEVVWYGRAGGAASGVRAGVGMAFGW